MDDSLELDLELVHETDLAYLLKDPATEDQEWFPKSLVEEIDPGRYELPTWLARKKGFY